ncbi:MAG: sulfatase-like hydrolase/transferase [Rhodobacterales bacterium]|nr:sulfatase-like hydrolase/transferase [Rhodobacterales bacterium]
MADLEKNANLDLLKNGLRGGMGFGAAVSIVHVGNGIGLILVLGLPALTVFAGQALLLEFVFASAIGTLMAPLYKLPNSRWTHPVLMMLFWLGLERWVAVDPSKLAMWVAPPIISLVVFAIGRAIFERKPAVTYGLAVALSAGLLLAPVIRDMGKEEVMVEVERGTPEAGAPDVLFIVMDTVRAQSSSVYGYERPTTPVLEELAKEGLLFNDANAPATWSLPAHAALFTGTFPSYNNANGETRFLASKPLPTLAEELARQGGYETRCFSANPHISDSFGLTRGFMANDKAWLSNDGGRNFTFVFRLIDAFGIGGADDKGGRKVVGNIEEWMASRPEDGPPQFVFVNFLEAHFPFHQVPEEFLWKWQNNSRSELNNINQIAFGVQFGRQLSTEEIERVRQPLTDLYDSGVLYTDYLVGQTVDIWRDAGMLDNTIVVIVGDHGEVVGEHDAFGHVTPVLEQDLRVPMLFRYPAKIPGGSTYDDAVSTVGIYATVMDLAGLDSIAKPQVTTLLPAIDGADVGKPVIAERFEEHMLASRFAPGTANGKGEQVNPHGRFRTYRSGDYKLVQHTTDGEFLFNLKEDPEEMYDIAEKEWKVFDQLKEELAEYQQSLGLPNLDAEVTAPREAPEMTASERQALIDLGYLEE